MTPTLHGGYNYVQNRVKGDTIYMMYKHRRASCKARLVKRGDVCIPKGSHSCDVQVFALVDVKNEMRVFIEDYSTTNLLLPPRRVYELAAQAMTERHGRQALDKLPRDVEIQLVMDVRRTLWGGDFGQAIQLAPLSCLSDTDPRLFFQFSRSFVSAQSNTIETAIAFAHPELVAMLRFQGMSLFCDGTIKVCPRAYYQIMILMAHLPSVNVYVPVFDVLTTANCSTTYKFVFHPSRSDSFARHPVREATHRHLWPRVRVGRLLALL